MTSSNQEATIKRLEAVASRLESVASRLARGGAGGGGDDDDEDAPFWVADYENIMKNELAAVIKSIDALGMPVCGALLQKGYDMTLDLVRRAPKSKQPSPAELQAFLKPGIDAISAADNQRYKGKKFKEFGDHYKALYDSILIISWVSLSPPNGLPAQHCDGQLQSADFNLNRILRRVGKTDVPQVTFIKAVQALNKAVKKFVSQNFKKTGLTYNPKGKALSETTAGASSTDSGASNSNSNSNSNNTTYADEQKEPAVKKSTATAKKGTGGDLFSSLRKGTDITKGMKKVTSDMKTKNRAKRSGKVTMKAKAKKGRKKFGPAGTSKRGPRWMIENYDEEHGVIEINKPTLKQNLFITMCDNCTINVTAEKVKAITIDNCRKTRVYFNQVVSTVELVNCQSVQLFVQGKAPSISVDKCESVNIILSRTAYADPPLLVTSNITAMNIALPGATEEDDVREMPIPEQFVTRIDNKNGTITTAATEH